jgi:hypothetical protein
MGRGSPVFEILQTLPLLARGISFVVTWQKTDILNEPFLIGSVLALMKGPRVP